MPRYTHALLVGLVVGSLHCNDDDDEFTKICHELCSSLACTDGVNVPDCTDELVDLLDAAADVGEDCHERYQVMIECAEAIVGCSEVSSWESQRGLDIDYPCRTETEKFIEACPDLPFNPSPH